MRLRIIFETTEDQTVKDTWNITREESARDNMTSDKEEM